MGQKDTLQNTFVSLRLAHICCILAHIFYITLCAFLEHYCWRVGKWDLLVINLTMQVSPSYWLSKILQGCQIDLVLRGQKIAVF